ncbi:PQQ-dependent sugar dehydrogenase [Phycicoccus sonneratiae]|uniref:PQQ-dependent sugar dehydrogenase n=1 Tax=Phycicoccus sonneratiae TaxID=2807628 RepID=A0ABS2CQS8_9MICO|nr:PQQ-dependent sugar dehydrogenase [Phycicoccus sonneraticus]MBM6402247.1 PQQ-dependent sugar dehydrogenase [Phycicoccus sonneraticus]
MPRPRRLSPPALVAALVAAAAVTTAGPATPASAAPTVQVTTVVSGLSNPWDLTWVGGLMLYDLRAGTVWSKRGSAAPRQVSISGFPSIFAQSEGGLLGMVADPAAASNNRFYTCQAVRDGSGNPLDVRVLRWRLTSDTTATSDGAPVVTGLPLSSGRHSGCRLRFGADGKLYVGTGDAAVGTNPQDLGSLGGKVLRVNPDGTIPSDNPFVARGGNARYVWTYGHRNVQGLALRPGTSELWSAEHGTSRDDEVNHLVKGANYGWDPVPGYDESRPMTDLTKFPSARTAMWSSGNPTVATSGAAFLTSPAWGAWRGALAVALLKDEGISLMRMDPTPGPSRVVEVVPLAQAEGFGRIRAVTEGPDGALWFTTSNGTADRIVRVAPTAVPPTLAGGRLVSPAGVTIARTGSEVGIFYRSTGDAVLLRRSTDDGASWAGAASTGVTSSDAPSATSSRAGRLDLVTRTAAGGVRYSWFTGGRRAGSTDLGGGVVTQHVVSLGDGTLDVFALSPAGHVNRRHFDGTGWGAWTYIGGTFTSGLSAAADPARGVVTVTGRSSSGTTLEREFSRTAALGSWTARSDGLSGWSDRALGDVQPGQQRLAVGVAADGAVVVQRGAVPVATPARWTSAGDIVSRPDGSYLLAGRSLSGALSLTYGGGPSGYASRWLGGTVR